MNVNGIHNVFIALHAASATLSFFAGFVLIFSVRHASNPRWLGLYWWTLAGMVVFLAGAMLVSWLEYSVVGRILFPGLFALGMYMLYRARNAMRLLQDQPEAWHHHSIEHIGFTLISLFEGFIIVSGLNSGLPGWLVAFFAFLGVFLGRSAIGLAQRRLNLEQTVAARK